MCCTVRRARAQQQQHGALHPLLRIQHAPPTTRTQLTRPHPHTTPACLPGSLPACLACLPACRPQKYPIDNTVLLAIEVVVMGLLEAKRYEGYKKTGEVRRLHAARAALRQQQQQQWLVAGCGGAAAADGAWWE